MLLDAFIILGLCNLVREIVLWLAADAELRALLEKQ